MATLSGEASAEQWLAAVPRTNSETGVARLSGRLIASGPDDFLHTFEDAQGEPSEVGERIMELADGARTVADIVDTLCEEFEVGRDECATDTVAFVKLLVSRKILVLV